MMRNQLRRVIAILSATAVVGGIAIISISAWQYRNVSAESGRDYLPAMQEQWSAETATVEIRPAALSSGTYLGVIQIASLKMKVNLFEGTESKALSKGAGHYVKSVMPGESDNSVIAGHRDTVFAPLGKIKIGAPIVITTRYGTFTYHVTGTRIVDKNDRTVIVPTESATVTLSTCYPFRFIGDAPQRFVVSALMVPKFS
jgi:sortase A